MSRDDVETLRQGYEAFARGDVEAVLERLDRDVDWRPAIAPILGVETVRGRDAVRDFLTRDLFDGFDEVGVGDVGGAGLSDGREAKAVLPAFRVAIRLQSSGLARTDHAAEPLSRAV